MSMSDAKIKTLLEKTTDFDKDERYMATSDLCDELKKNGELGTLLEPKLCAAILKQLDDKSIDVQSIAVKCLSILVTKVKERQLMDICSKLCELIQTGKPELRDIYSIGLKTILGDIAQVKGSYIASQLTTSLLIGLQSQSEAAIKFESLDILTEILRRFGLNVVNVHEELMDLLLQLLQDETPLVVKRSNVCVGYLGMVLSEELLTKLILHLVRGIQSFDATSNENQTLIQAIGTLSRTAGHRLGKHLSQIIPLLQKFCGNAKEEDLQTEEYNELRENCFHAFEAFVIHCPREITPYMEEILHLVMDFIVYDPNYTYDDDEDMEGSENNDYDMGSDDGYEEEDYSDQEEEDDDTSWKVRRAVLKLLVAIIQSRPEILGKLYESIVPILIRRFKEREEKVRIDIFHVFSELLDATAKAKSTLHVNLVATELTPRIPEIVKHAVKQLEFKNASVSCKCAIIGMLKHLIVIENGNMGDYVPSLLPPVITSGKDKHSDLKFDSMELLTKYVEAHTPQVFDPYLEDMITLAVQSANGEWYKTVAKSLQMMESLIRIVRPDAIETTVISLEPPNSRAQDLGSEMFEAVLVCLRANDIDREIKETAITTMGSLLAALGDCESIKPKISDVTPLLLERLQNEMTRIPSMKSIAQMSRAKVVLDCADLFSEATAIMTQFLRQQSRALRFACLEALNDIIVNSHKSLPANLVADVILEACGLLKESDLQLCKLGMQLVVHAIISTPDAITDSIRGQVLDQTLFLSHNALITGPTLESLHKFMIQLVGTLISFEDFFSRLLELTKQLEKSQSNAVNKQSFLTLASCIATVCVTGNQDQREYAFKQLLLAAQEQNSDTQKLANLYCLGEYGRLIPFANEADSLTVKKLVMDNFQHPSDDVRSATSTALGAICVGNMEKYLNLILEKLEDTSEGDKYLVIGALREVIVHHTKLENTTLSDLSFEMHIQRIAACLLHVAQSENESMRNLVAECLGRLTITDAQKILPLILTQLCVSSNVHARWTGVTALKFALKFSPTTSPAVQLLFQNMEPFLTVLKNDNDLNVKRAALLTLNTAAHHHPELLALHMHANLLPLLLSTMEMKVVRTVDLGPFKHKVDDGLPLRKAAYACVDSMLEYLIVEESMDNMTNSFFPLLAAGLKDQDEIQIVCHQTVVKLVHLLPSDILVGKCLEYIVDPLEKTVMKKVKEDQVGPEVDRMKDLIRSAMRAVERLNGVSETHTHAKFRGLIDQIHKSPSLNEIMETISQEHVKA